AEVINLDILQIFNISAIIWAKTAPYEEDARILNYEIDVNGCDVGEMLSRKLKNSGIGYFLDSIVVNISPMPVKQEPHFHYKYSQPRQSNREIEYSKSNEKNINLQFGGSNSGVSGVITGGINTVHNTKFSSKEWKLSYKGPNNNGERWLYQFFDDSLDKYGSSRECFAPGTHSGQWLTKKEVQGFCITITQVLRCEVAHDLRSRFRQHIKTNLLKHCPKMSHSLKVTFKDLKNFNAKFTQLNRTLYTNNGKININVGSKGNEEKYTENQEIQNLNGEIEHSIVRSAV
ncbi:8647_t:CDS:1, partial [Funneliformis geosporum]